MSDVGYIIIILSLVLGILQCISGLCGKKRKRKRKRGNKKKKK